MDPIDEAMQAKEAFLGSFFGGASRAMKKNVGSRASRMAGEELIRGLGAGAGTALIGAGVAVAAVGVKKLIGAAHKKRDFRSMMELNPDLASQQKKNPKFFNTSYNSLRSLNPAYGKDPVVAGSLMRRMMENPATAGGILMSTMKPPTPDQGGLGIRGEFRAGPFSMAKDIV
jgi:hypothetical protein